MAQARRVALAAQGFGGSPAGPVTAARLLRIAQRVGAIQIDSVNVVTRSHYLPFYSRLGPYDPGLLDGLREATPDRPARLVEYWAHEASLVPAELWPWFGFRMRRAEHDAWGGMRRVAVEHPDLVRAVEEVVATAGPLTARQAEAVVVGERPMSRPDWGWNWSLVKNALEYLFWSGRVTSAGRTAQFERRYVVVDDALRRGRAGDPGHRSDEEAYTHLVAYAARAHGVATERCLRDYFRLRPAQVRPALHRLVAAGELVPVSVQGWARPAYLHRDSRVPRRMSVSALLSPFDSLVWTRTRTAALFGFDYRLEIYTPAPRRVHGYYVLPFLFGDELVARADLRADRTARMLQVKSVHWEPAAPLAAREALGAELARLAGFLGLDGVSASQRARGPAVPGGLAQ